MKILLASSEVYPYSKSGGLGDMLAALSKSLARAGHEVGLVTPLYRGIREKHTGLELMDWELELPMGDEIVAGQVWERHLPDGLTVYFIDCPFYYDRAALYCERAGDYPDNAERFLFLSKSVVNLARYLPWKPEVIHVHDWQTATVAPLVSAAKWRDGWTEAAPVVLTIHNLEHQGRFSGSKFALTNLPPDYMKPGGMEYFGDVNYLKAGIVWATGLTTVSPRYAREITTEQYGCGLDGVLRQRQKALRGILNGVDYDEWTTSANPYLAHSYSPDDLRGKVANKTELQQELHLPVRADVPLFATVARLAGQKGVDIQLGALEEMLSADLQFVLLGSGGRDFERAYRRLAHRYPAKCAVKIGFDTMLSHRIEAACDFFIMPSRFEPCGLNQLYSLRYGSVPIVRVTGGLDDSVIDVTEDEDGADGIKFHEYSVRALAKAIRKALVLYDEKELLDHYRRNGMTKDFSWERSVANYEQVYEQALAQERASKPAELTL